MRSRRVAPIAAVLALCATASAHETWMMPMTFHANPGEEIRLDLTSGMGFPRLEHPIRPERVVRAVCRIGGETIAIAKRDSADSSLALRVTPPRTGLATVALDLGPREIVLADDKVAEYLDEIAATEEIRARWAGLQGKRPWKENYTKHAKTFVTVGAATADSSWATAIGGALEFVPASDPTRFTAGDSIGVTLLSHGSPVAGLPVGLAVEGLAAPVFRTTDARGCVAFRLPRDGRAMFYTVRLRYRGGRWTWTSDFCTLTFEIRRPS